MHAIDAIQLSVTTERAFERSIIEVLQEEGAKGYTTYECGGNGAFHMHPTDHAPITDAFLLIKIEVIIQDADHAERIAERLLEDYFQHQPGIVTLKQVKVFRPQKF